MRIVMVAVGGAISIERDAPIPTWIGVGGRADRLCRAASVEGVQRCLEIDPGLKVLGDGANLLVCDEGVGELVVVLDGYAFRETVFDERAATVRVGAGANLAKLVHECARRGLAGIEGLIGIPATIGGAVVMNAGGAFGEMRQSVSRIFGVDRGGQRFERACEEIDFGYRRSGLDDVIVTEVELRLRRGDSGEARRRVRECMEYKARVQPMHEDSAGCCFKNAVLSEDIEGIGQVGQRVSAGLVIDRAGCKGMSVGGAVVSDRHANFIITREGARASDIIELMKQVQQRVREAFGVRLEREIVVWERSA